MTLDSKVSNSLVRLEVDGRHAVITLNRPERHNSLVPELMSSLLKALDKVAQCSRNLTSLVIRAEGRNFSTGGDVRVFYEAGEQRRVYADNIVGQLNQIMLGLMRLPLPVICRVQGWVTGGSLGLLLASDLVVIGENTQIAPFYSVVGFSPDGGWSALLPGRIGLAKTKEIQMLNKTISATEALQWGLVNRVVSEADLDRQVAGWQCSLDEKVSSALLCAKRTLQYDQIAQIETALERERESFVDQIIRPEVESGMRQFLGL